MSRVAYEGLIRENIEWLLKNTESCLERAHIISVLKVSSDHEYEDCRACVERSRIDRKLEPPGK